MKPKETLARFAAFLGIDLQDCVALAPNHEELKVVVAPWIEAPDANVDWPAPVRATLEDLQRRLGRGV